MKLLVYADLHTEFESYHPPDVSADVIVLAGDIGVGLGGLEFAARLAERAPVVYVAGNHEYYRGVIPSLTDKLRARALEKGVYFLENESAVIDGVRFIGCTLWTDFMLLGADRQQACMLEAREMMSDFSLIRRSPSYSRLSPMDTVLMHRVSLDFLEQELSAEPSGGTTAVVVTHHAPSPRSVPERHTGSPLSPAFASVLDELVESSNAALWIHGHTHHCVDYTIGSTRVVSNQRGYPGERVTGFRHDFTLNVER